MYTCTLCTLQYCVHLHTVYTAHCLHCTLCALQHCVHSKLHIVCTMYTGKLCTKTWYCKSNDFYRPVSTYKWLLVPQLALLCLSCCPGLPITESCVQCAFSGHCTVFTGKPCSWLLNLCKMHCIMSVYCTGEYPKETALLALDFLAEMRMPQYTVLHMYPSYPLLWMTRVTNTMMRTVHNSDAVDCPTNRWSLWLPFKNL